MMKQMFTTVTCPDFRPKASYLSKVSLLGSCFTENIGGQLIQHGISTIVNPYGIIFNPISLARAVKNLVRKEVPREEELATREDVYLHVDFHSRFSGVDRKSVIDGMIQSVMESSVFLSQSDYLILTLGTAWVYKLRDSGQVVNNCHKLPSHHFEKVLLEEEEVVRSLSEALDVLHDTHPKIQVLLTLSPVRHWKDGAMENSLSKARLRSAIHTLSQREGVSYFPAYEIMMDELRDYRYYASDLLHPDAVAQEVIWNRFIDSFFDVSAQAYLTDIAAYLRMEAHRPLIPDAQASKHFKEQVKARRNELMEKWPGSGLWV